MRIKSTLSQGIPFTDFTYTMTEGGSQHQQTVTAATAEPNLEYMSIGLFGDTESDDEKVQPIPVSMNTGMVNVRAHLPRLAHWIAMEIATSSSLR